MMIEKHEDYKKKIQTHLDKALAHLQYSFNKVQKLPTLLDALDEESLATWESFSARFSRVVDIFLMRYVKAVVKFNDPGFDGTLRDYLNQAEKLKLIDDAKEWIQLRELRNITAHEYTDKDLSEFFQRLRSECPRVLKLKFSLPQG